MKRRTLLLSTAGLTLTATRCAPRGPSLEPLHPAAARFHDPLASGVIDRERWIVDSLPGAEVYATNESMRLAITDGLTATARPRLPTLDSRLLEADEIAPVREDLQWEALIHRRLPYLMTVTVELAPSRGATVAHPAHRMGRADRRAAGGGSPQPRHTLLPSQRRAVPHLANQHSTRVLAPVSRRPCTLVVPGHLCPSACPLWCYSRRPAARRHD